MINKLLGGLDGSIKYEKIVSIDNLLGAWREFLCGKRNKRDVQEFSLNLMDNIFDLHDDLTNLTYKHGSYRAFNISDPKPRNIHKATVCDRLLHHVIYRKLYSYFDKKFIADSYSCRLNKGTHRAINRFHSFFWKVSQNNSRTCWVLKCDIKKFFANINHEILKKILKKNVADKNVLWLLNQIINSFNPGLPLGNLTSQMLVNIYMNKFDQFTKHKLKVKYYIRYADDFVILSQDKGCLENIINPIKQFLQEELKLEIHPNKIFIKTFASGVDFLGWAHFSDHRVLRTTTKRRMLKRLKNNPAVAIIASYLGLLKHGNTHKIKQKLVQLQL